MWIPGWYHNHFIATKSICPSRFSPSLCVFPPFMSFTLCALPTSPSLTIRFIFLPLVPYAASFLSYIPSFAVPPHCCLVFTSVCSLSSKGRGLERGPTVVFVRRYYHWAAPLHVLYCRNTPGAKYPLFGAHSILFWLHLVVIELFQRQASLCIHVSLGWQRQTQSTQLGSILIVKSSGWGFESILCYFYDSCIFIVSFYSTWPIMALRSAAGVLTGEQLMLHFTKFPRFAFMYLLPLSWFKHKPSWGGSGSLPALDMMCVLMASITTFYIGNNMLALV